jgi:hypothetical protein
MATAPEPGTFPMFGSGLTAGLRSPGTIEEFAY